MAIVPKPPKGGFMAGLLASGEAEVTRELEQSLAAAQAEARELRAELARLRLHYIGVIALLGRVAVRLDGEDRECIAAAMHDAKAEHGLNMVRAGRGWSLEISDALSPAPEHDTLAVSDHCPECVESEPECVCEEQPAAPAPELPLWCIHIPGPDDLLAMPDKETADRTAEEHNLWVAMTIDADMRDSCLAVVKEWPHSDEAHAEALAAELAAAQESGDA